MESHIGTSGFSYTDWVGKFYPKGLPREEWLTYYATKFDTVELNVTFYRTPKKETFTGWYKETPDNFHFVIKGSQFITHRKRLQGVEESLKYFFEAAQPLKEKAKVVLWQLPPNFPADLERLRTFLESLGQNFAAAKISQNEPVNAIRYAFEFRHKSWLTDDTYDLLRKHNAALVFSDHPFQITKPATADFIYIRRHGPGGQYHIVYPNQDIAKDVRLIKQYDTLTYEFFNNDVQAAGAKNALDLKEMLEG